MKSKQQKRGVTSRKKAVSGISHLLRDGSERNNDSNERNQDRHYGRTRNANHPFKQNRNRQGREEDSFMNDEDFNEDVSYDRFNDYASHRDQFTPQQLRYGTVDGHFYNYMQRNGGRGNDITDDRYDQRNESGQSRNMGQERNYQRSYHEQDENRRRPFNDHGYEGRSKKHEKNSYGEHPDSGGAKEYHGSNKRHPGLVGQHDFDEGQQRRAQRNTYSNRNDDDRENDHEYRHRRGYDSRFDDEEYLNRGQYEIPFHGRDRYDPEQNEREERFPEERYSRHSNQHDGYQTSGNTEGFGIRGRERHGQDWLDEDQYRRGHAQRKNGYGKFGSR